MRFWIGSDNKQRGYHDNQCGVNEIVPIPYTFIVDGFLILLVSLLLHHRHLVDYYYYYYYFLSQNSCMDCPRGIYQTKVFRKGMIILSYSILSSIL